MIYPALCTLHFWNIMLGWSSCQLWTSN